MGSGTTLRFDRFVLDCGDERLVGPHGPVHIGNKAFQVLCALVHQRGKLLTKETLFETVWDGTFVSESALTSVIKELRRALGDESKSPRFIDTVYGRGYRFIADVEEVDDRERVPFSEVDRPVRKRAELALPDKPSLAVLPFAEFGDGVEHWFADGIVEEIVVALSRFQTLFVIATGSSLTYRESTAPADIVARELGVHYLLGGSVQRSADRVRVIAKLIDGVSGERIWADRFDDTIDDIFELQVRVAHAVAGRIGSSINDAEIGRAAMRPTKSATASELYWRANAMLRRMDPASLAEAIALAEQVLALETQNPWITSLLAFCHGLQVNMGWTSDVSGTRHTALMYYEQAVRGGGEDERVLGFCGAALISIGGDVVMAARLIDRAIELNSGSATALFWGGWADAINGRPERGAERIRRSIRLNPASSIRPLLLIPLGICLLTLRRFDEAAEVLSESVEMAPQGGGLAALVVALTHAGREAEADVMRERLIMSGGSWAGLELLQRPEDIALVREAAVGERALVA